MLKSIILPKHNLTSKVWNLSAGGLIWEPSISQKSYTKLRNYETFPSDLILVLNNIYYDNRMTITIFKCYCFKTSITFDLQSSQALLLCSTEPWNSLGLWPSDCIHVIHTFFPYLCLQREICIWVCVSISFSYLRYFLRDSRLNLQNYLKEPFGNSGERSVQHKIQKIKIINK